jgi:uncharacterized protein (DUF433 family)
MGAKETNVVAAFTEEQAHRLTGVSLRQMRYWASDGFFVPSIILGREEGEPSIRLYSFRDLVCLKVLSALRNETRCSLSHLRDVKDRLSHLGEDLWAKTTLYVLGKRVVFDNPVTGGKEDAGSGQGVLEIPLAVVTGDMKKAVADMRRRDSETLGQIDTKRGGVGNPVVAGTRIPVRTIQEFAEAGYSVEAILKQYPSLTEGDIAAAINYRPAA